MISVTVPPPTQSRVARTLPHVVGLIAVAALAVAVGSPIGWVGIGAFVGPALVVAVSRRRTADDLEAVAFGAVIALMTAGGWALTQAPSLHQAFVVAYPIALLAFLFGACNFVLVACSRTLRAWRGDELDYPWLTEPVRARVAAIREREEHHGHR